jgi:hypothetical protein
MVEYMQLNLHSFAGPVITIFVIAYFIAGMWMDVYTMSIKTTLHCFIADEEMFGGRARYADGSLEEWINENAADPSLTSSNKR